MSVPATTRASEYIRLKPAVNFHHGIRMAHHISLDLNLFVSINLSLTDCTPERSSLAFAKLRAAFGKWITRPKAKQRNQKLPPTFVWVLENPDGCLHAHWLLHVPNSRKDEFQKLLPCWVEACAGSIHGSNAIDMKPANTPTAAGKYMLKGMHPHIAAMYDIRHSDQGRVIGKRIGTSKNLGPTQKRHLRRAGKYPPSRRWVSFSKWASLQAATNAQQPH